DPRHLVVGEHEAAVDGEEVVARLQDHHVEADLPEAAEGDDPDGRLDGGVEGGLGEGDPGGVSGGLRHTFSGWYHAASGPPKNRAIRANSSRPRLSARRRPSTSASRRARSTASPANAPRRAFVRVFRR